MEMIKKRHDPNKYRVRYLLKVKTTAYSVEMTDDQLLVVGTHKGRLLTFNLGLLDHVENNNGQHDSESSITAVTI